MEADFLIPLVCNRSGINPEPTYEVSEKSFRPVVLKFDGSSFVEPSSMGRLERSKTTQKLRIPLTVVTRSLTASDRVRWRGSDWEIVSIFQVPVDRQVELVITS